MGGIFTHKFFGALDGTAQQEIHDHFSKIIQGDLPKWDNLDLFRHRNFLVSNIHYISKRLKDINPASFQFLNKPQREALLNELLFSFYMISAHYHLDDIESRKQNSAKQLQELQLCTAKIMALQSYNLSGPETIHEQLLYSSDKPVKYLGLKIVAPFLVEKIEQISSGKAVSFRSWWDDLNSQRAYLARANAVLLGILRILPDDFMNKIQGQTVLSAPAPVFGYLSWILYYVRFGINLGLLLKHSIQGSWMKDEEAQIPWNERFTTQWEQRRFILINDFIWATTNMSCFYWLLGTPKLSYTANVLTLTFMTIDIGLVLWRFMAESTEHNKNEARYIEDIEAVHTKISQLEENDRQKTILEEELKMLLRAKFQFDLDWKYKTYGIVNDLFYTGGLLVSFAVTSALFTPSVLIPTNVLMFSLVGAVICFAVTLAYSAVTNTLTIMKTTELADMTKEDLEVLMTNFSNCEDEQQKKLLYLDIQALFAKSEYQEKLIQYQKLKLIHSVFINSVLPVLAFSCFVFMPLGIGIAVFAVGFVLAKFSERKLQELAPQEADLPDFDDESYRQFTEQTKTLEAPIAKASFSARFFKSDLQLPAQELDLQTVKKLTNG
jgi:hypothetical protein